jgi:hypothetical protein
MQARHDNRPIKMASGDRVRVRATPEAIAAGVAGMVGDIVGFARPSSTDAAVIGAKSEDYAVNVSLKEKEGTFLFAKDQLEILEHASSPEGKSAGKDPETPPAAARPKPWWKFGL